MPRGVHLTRKVITCGICSTKFSCVASDLDRKYCSIKCRGKARSTLKDINCKECGKLFHPSRKTNTLCSIECRGRYRARIRHGLAKGEHTKARKIKLVKEREKCDLCGWNTVVEVLELHHKDRNRKNNALDNLMLLCPNCHSTEHYKHKDGQFKNNIGRP